MEDHARRRVFRLGVLLTASAVGILSLALSAPGGPRVHGVEALWLIAFGLIAVTGIGLMAQIRVARAVGMLVYLGLAGMCAWEFFEARRILWPETWDLGSSLALANAFACSLLLAWLCIRAVLVLLGRARSGGLATARLTGGVLAVVAVHHLWLATQVDTGWTGAWSVSFSTNGTYLIGFVGWPIWHAAMLVAALALLAGPRRILSHAATAVMLLLALVVPLMLVAALPANFQPPEVIILGVILLPIYLAWWLRDELRTPVG